MNTNDELLEIKYYPKTWDDLILPTEIKEKLHKIKDKQGYRVIFFSSPGTGKTTSSRIITIGHDILYLSGSNDFSVKTVREKIMPFASGFSVMNKQKTIIIDECDHIRNDLQDAFKIIFDKCKNVNFIFITNAVEAMNEPLMSRFAEFDYDFNGANLEEHRKLYTKFAIDVCYAENIKFEPRGLKSLILRNFPDFRHLLVNLQEIKDVGVVITEEYVKSMTESGKRMNELYEIIENPVINGEKLYSEATKFKSKEKDCFMSLGEPFFTYLNEKNQYDKTLQCALVVSKYSEMYVTSINKFVTFLSCIVELKSLFR